MVMAILVAMCIYHSCISPRYLVEDDESKAEELQALTVNTLKDARKKLTMIKSMHNNIKDQLGQVWKMRIKLTLLEFFKIAEEAGRTVRNVRWREVVDPPALQAELPPAMLESRPPGLYLRCLFSVHLLYFLVMSRD